MEHEYKNILVAIDGSQEAECAFNKAISIAKRNGAHLLIAHVIDTRIFSPADVYDSTITEKIMQFSSELLEGYKKTAINAGVADVDYVIEIGSPRVVIPDDIAKRNNFDLIICGARGLNAIERLFIGSVSEHIVRYANCDVLVVRTNKEELEP